MANNVDINPLLDILVQFRTYMEVRNHWTPCWKRPTERPPQNCTYEWRHEITGQLLFMVEVSKSGVIHVLQDDWLSKYTMAIHHSINVDKTFIRINKNTGVCEEISNVDKIFTNELIIHFPTLLHYIDWIRRTYYDRDADPNRIPPDDLKNLFFLAGVDPTDNPGANVVKKIAEQIVKQIAGRNVLGTIFKTIKNISKIHPIVLDELRKSDSELIIEKFYAAIISQVYWIYTDEEIDYDARVPNIVIPASDTDHQILIPYIPSIPFKVNPVFANPIVWFDKYVDFFYGKTDDQINYKLNTMKAIWEEKFNGTINILSAFKIFEDSYADAKLVTKGGRPNLTKVAFKKEMRTYGNYELSPAEFYDVLCENYLEMIQREWTGVSTPLKILVDFVNDPARHYKLEAL